MTVGVIRRVGEAANVFLMCLVIGDEGSDMMRRHLRRRRTLCAWSVSCRLAARWPVGLAPRRPMLNVGIGTCSTTHLHTLLSFP